MIYLYGDSHTNNCFKNLTLPHTNFYSNSITMFRIGRDNNVHLRDNAYFLEKFIELYEKIR
jgi:hypothetical protein